MTVFRTLFGMTVLLGLGALGLVLNLRKQDPNSLLGNLPDDLSTAREAFCDRVRTQIGPGTSETRLVRVLAREGFRVNPADASATYQQRNRHMRRVWKVTWDATGGQVAAIRAGVGVSAYG